MSAGAIPDIAAAVNGLIVDLDRDDTCCPNGTFDASDTDACAAQEHGLCGNVHSMNERIHKINDRLAAHTDTMFDLTTRANQNYIDVHAKEIEISEGGIHGDKGEMGFKGHKGAVGVEGATGATGPKGAVGAAGDAAQKGTK